MCGHRSYALVRVHHLCGPCREAELATVTGWIRYHWATTTAAVASALQHMQRGGRVVPMQAGSSKQSADAAGSTRQSLEAGGGCRHSLDAAAKSRGSLDAADGVRRSPDAAGGVRRSPDAAGSPARHADS
jgi:hypothetical protein